MSPEQEGAQRLPPQNLDAERSVLGSILRDNNTLDDVIHIVQTPHFYTHAHQLIFDACLKIRERGEPIDLVTLAEYLRAQKQIEDIGREPYLADLWDAAPTAANAVYYARIVRDKALVRNLIHASTEVLRDAYDQALPAAELLESAEKKIFDIAQMGVTGQYITLQKALNDAYLRIDQRTQRGPMAVSGIATHYVDLDEKTAGFQNSELVIIAARPSVGKTAFSLNLIRNMIVNDQRSVFFVSLEMSRLELAERLLCSQGRVDSHRLRKGHLNADDMQKLIEAGGILGSAKLFIDDSPAQGMLRIAANARRLKMREKLDIVFIDYLQLIEPDNKRDSRQEQVGNISRRLKFLAKELEIPVIALAQVNRSSEDRQDHKPRLSDLRESGSIEQDADTVMLLHRPDAEPGQAGETIDVIIAKQRNGPTDTVTLTFVKQYMRFENFAVEAPFSYSP
ncbi:MAG: replicative DNA helicase [Gemmataceae bacterium]|nr:replicative DNA helicase [Gemmataceae bacterium]